MPIYLDEYGYNRYLKRFEEMEPVFEKEYIIVSGVVGTRTQTVTKMSLVEFEQAKDELVKALNLIASDADTLGIVPYSDLRAKLLLVTPVYAGRPIKRCPICGSVLCPDDEGMSNTYGEWNHKPASEWDYFCDEEKGGCGDAGTMDELMETARRCEALDEYDTTDVARQMWHKRSTQA